MSAFEDAELVMAPSQTRLMQFLTPSWGLQATLRLGVSLGLVVAFQSLRKQTHKGLRLGSRNFQQNQTQWLVNVVIVATCMRFYCTRSPCIRRQYGKAHIQNYEEPLIDGDAANTTLHHRDLRFAVQVSLLVSRARYNRLARRTWQTRWSQAADR